MLLREKKLQNLGHLKYCDSGSKGTGEGEGYDKTSHKKPGPRLEA